MPNIVMITAHDLGKHLGCYGQETVRSPNLDRLAESGVLFENSFCTGPTCSPSRAALHTGRYAHSNGVMGLTGKHFGWKLKPDEKHMACLLLEQGYDTALIGVQHVTPDDPRELGYLQVYPEAPAPDVAEQAVKYLQCRKYNDKPFYLEVGFFEPHRPYTFGGAKPDSALGVRVPDYLPDHEDARRDVAALQGAIRALDGGVGTVLDALRDLGLEENTWIIFTTDHGLAMPRAKSTLYDPGIEATLMMQWNAGGLHGGRRIAELVSNVDIVPTVLHGLGAEIPDNVQGVSFWDAMKGSHAAGRTAVFSEKNFHTQYEPMRSIRTECYKLIVNFEVNPRVNVPSDIQEESPIYKLMIDQCIYMRDKVELYDLQEDPMERRNLSGHKEHRAIENKLKNMLHEWMLETEDPILLGPIASPYYHDAVRRLHYE